MLTNELEVTPEELADADVDLYRLSKQRAS
jgi:hypothetical protein